LTGKGETQFGWSLGNAPYPLPAEQLANLAARLGMSVVKLPLWHSEGTSAGDATRTLLNQLRSRDLHIVGVLADPPAEDRKSLFGDPTADASAASLLQLPTEKLRPTIEAVVLPLAVQVHDWQLGADTDRSLAGAAEGSEGLAALRVELAKAGMPVRLAAPIDWNGLAAAEDVFACLLPRSAPPIEMDHRLTNLCGGGAKPWLTLEPQGPTDGSAEQRTADFVQRLVLAAAGKVELVVVCDPFGSSSGFFDGGSPGELLLPYSVAASQLSGVKYLGRLEVPGGSQCRVFERGEQITLALWNADRTTERLSLGANAAGIDVWGRETHLPSAAEIAAGPMPIFVRVVDAGAIRTQLGVAIDPPRLPSIPSAAHPLRVRVPNCFGRPVSLKVSLHVPERWRVVSPRTVPLDLAAGAEAIAAFQLRLPLDGASGRQPLRLEFELAGEEPRRFTVYRQLEVGLGDVELVATARLDEQGNLLVRQQLAWTPLPSGERSGEGRDAANPPLTPTLSPRGRGSYEALSGRGATAASFACQLSIPGRRTQRVTVRLSAGAHEHVYVVPHGQELIGKKLRLRADELGGQRVLSQSITPLP
jgi:hypothetical protein